jgi:FAD synthetase
MKVLTFGTFDRLHPGHIHYLTQASLLGDSLYTIVALDQTVQKTKKQIPKFTHTQRLQNLKNLNLPSHTVILGHPSDPYHFLNIIQPDIIALGYDQSHFTYKLSKLFPNTHIQRIDNYKEKLFKSSIIAKFKPKNEYSQRKLDQPQKT